MIMLLFRIIPTGSLPLTIVALIMGPSHVSAFPLPEEIVKIQTRNRHNYDLHWPVLGWGNSTAYSVRKMRKAKKVERLSQYSQRP